jgi:outer membrane protein TolC
MACCSRASRLRRHCLHALTALAVVLLSADSEPASGQEKSWRLFRREERTLNLPDPPPLPRFDSADVPPTATVADLSKNAAPQTLGLDDAIRIALANTRAIRVLAGTTAVNSGATIYDPAIAATAIEEAKGRFDPNLNINNTFARQSQPGGSFDPLDPSRALIDSLPTKSYDMNLGLSKVNTLGGTARLGVDVNPSRAQAPPGTLPLNPQTRSSIELSYTQPLLQGAGRAVNLAPIVIARLNTERSYFQMKDSMQQSVRSVIGAYWAVVFARTDVWARKRQVDQGQEALERAEAGLASGRENLGGVAQARSALANFKATAIASEANLLNQEAALASILGLPPSMRLVPISPPSERRLTIDWKALLGLAEERRPDLIELKLIIEADQQGLIQANNQAMPRLDAVMLYRWNGLEGTVPNGGESGHFGGKFTEWNMGVNFSVPLGLRQARAALRSQELILARDRANLDQGVQTAIQGLALRIRNLSQFYEQYLAYRQARVAARVNLDLQLENYRQRRTIFLNVLQAITDWGNAVSAESQSLTQYNAELANLEAETGTILESHGVRFFEERYFSIGPLGRLARDRRYPESLRPGPNEAKYPNGSRPAENVFDLEDPLKPRPEPTPSNGKTPR